MTEVALDVTVHFDALREPAWKRLRSRHGALLTRDQFDDAYAEWWAREVERGLDGRPSTPDVPIAFVVEAVHRVLLDELRSRGRGLSRGAEKAALDIVDIDDQVDVAAAEVTPAQAAYEALAHRVLGLVHDRLSPRELRVFVWTYLYLRSTPETAAATGLSEPRVRKDRKKVAAKVGQEVWSLIGAELEMCAEYSEPRMAAAFETFVAHAEDCPECSRSVGDFRTGAAAIAGPLELLAVGGPSGSGSALSDLVDGLTVRVGMLFHRAVDAATTMPYAGRATALAAVGAAVVAGGAATVSPLTHDPPAKRDVIVAATPAPTATPSPAPTAGARPAGTATPRPRPRPVRLARTPVPVVTPAATTTANAPRAITAAATPVPTSSPPTGGEFGFERP